MITICEKTGIQFETESKRTKNHPQIMALVNQANRDGNYRTVLTACETIKAQGNHTIESAIEYINAVVAGAEAAYTERRRIQAQQERELEQARREARERRQAQNAHLKQHGYRWSKDYANFDEYEEGEPSQWNLYSPDNRIVDVAQALDEIGRGVDVVLAEIAERNSVAAKAVADKEAAEEAEEQKLDAAKAEVKALGHRAEAFDYKGLTNIYRRSGGQYATMIDEVWLGTINGVQCGAIYHYFGGHDFYETISYWCADPVAAGLIPIAKSGDTSLSSTFAAFFGE